MLDISFHQGAGLHRFTPQAALRVLAVVSQELAAAGSDTLWQICASLQRLGYPVMVLDGTACESEDSPGLWHLLQHAAWNDGANLHAEAVTSSLAVIPAARGLQRIQQLSHSESVSPLAPLLPYFRSYGLLIVHAPASSLGPLLRHTATTPLVVMRDESTAVLDSYSSLKQIALHTGLPCMVTALLHDDTAAERHKAQTALQSLQDCTERHLGLPLSTCTIATQNPQDLQRLALQLLENAGTINSDLLTVLPASPLTGAAAHFVRSH
jgi:hypothetical protein